MGKGSGEAVKSKSPAEFFADNQNIAGFDNAGKSLYTTIRELVENSLDAAESIGALPHISLTIEEFTEEEFNEHRGMDNRDVVDAGLFKASGGKKSTSKATKALPKPAVAEEGSADDPQEPSAAAGATAADLDPKEKKAKNDKKGRSKGDSHSLYYRVKCKDNGVGMPHDKIPDMLGVVLSSSKYGVRQARGKYGMGAKMALIWSKKSTGLPIQVVSGCSSDVKDPPNFLTKCVLDIDIYKNRPSVHEHVKLPNPEGWRGTEMTVCVSGNWQTYKSRVLQYLQQLAIITPYAELELEYHSHANPKKDLTAVYRRRSEQMPPLAYEVKHHPGSVNNLLVQQLIHRTKCKDLVGFLMKDLSSIDRPLSERIIAELGEGFHPKMQPSALTVKMVSRLTQMLRDVKRFKPPDGACLSPAGEYNLRQVKEGVNVYRFANRIPLLFEAGSDVVTRVAMKRINWSSYKVDHKRDKIGVFVSTVSTKIPFKGTSKEYIGDDTEEIKKAVKHALQQCCQQLRTHLLRRNALREQKERKKVLTKYIPDVSRAVFGLLTAMQKRARDGEEDKGGGAGGASKRARGATAKTQIMASLDSKEVTEKTLAAGLSAAVNQHDAEAAKEESVAAGRGTHSRQV
ncbi:DNA topoisomerase VI subunit B-like protein Topoisomerase 6 subunit B [Ectocarpus siliculosus]|uniref:DNA topoisomerase VI subunit B-like protein Topoisomerase 6 subunit B n=1 Tax=Ectocarpus siliculosus TaxID=2880 RepID=D7FR51_ECTSI|nr:DNA topoisomerase VI subunit B-like protein Topoisomerase 6 subunit B [Ectocarpus siliculosus]|eukprot:CBJ26118.1 DNA topoisomerase VI subunit B-like protein Topoisomerase 6 subunit B [Ectocarpus siliculosus]